MADVAAMAAALVFSLAAALLLPHLTGQRRPAVRWRIPRPHLRLPFWRPDRSLLVPAAPPVPFAPPGFYRPQPADPGAQPVPFRADGPRLPARVVVRCDWHGSFFHGWCGAPAGPGQLSVRGAALRGGMHAAMDAEGQDAVGALWERRGEALFLAVADGLGSLPMSGRMAYEAVSAALHLCTTKPAELPFEAAGGQFFAAIAAGLRRSFGPRAESEGGTTMVVAELRPTERGADVVVHGVGDSEAWVCDAGRWFALHHERGPVDGHGDRADNATRDLPHDPRPRTSRCQIARGGILLLATDGFAERMGSGSGWAAHLAGAWHRPPRPLEFVRLVEDVTDDLSDDRGVVAVWVR